DNVLNVAFYGARGDGVQDNGRSLEQAMYYLFIRGGGTLLIPEGTYFADIFPVYAGVNVKGAGMEATVFDRRDGSNYLVRYGRGGDARTEISHLTFKNPDRVLLLHGRSHITFHNVAFLDGQVRFEQSAYITIDRSYFENNAGKAAYASDHVD